MKRALPVLTIALALGSCKSSLGPDQNYFAGTWTGTVTQPNGPIQQIWDYTLTLEQTASTLSGTSRIQFQTGSASPQSYGDFEIVGTVGTPGTIHVVETKITNQVPPPNGGFWCFKIEDLTYAGGHLTGPWTATNCVNFGNIDLVKKK